MFPSHWPHLGIALHSFAASLNRKCKQLLGKPLPRLGMSWCLITLCAQNQPQLRPTGLCIAGAAGEMSCCRTGTCSATQPSWKCCLSLGEGRFSSHVCRCFIDAVLLFLVSADR